MWSDAGRHRGCRDLSGAGKKRHRGHTSRRWRTASVLAYGGQRGTGASLDSAGPFKHAQTPFAHYLVPMNGINKDIDPASELREEDDESSLPEMEQNAPTGTLAAGRAAILRFVKLAPSAPGVYRMIDAQGDVLYVGKAKNIKKRVTAYSRPTSHDNRIARMIASTATLEFVSTKTETEALLLEANLIKRLRPRFNVLLRDDKSFP